MGWLEILAAIGNKQQQLDQQMAQICSGAIQQRVTIYCEKGCCNCCTLAVNCSFAEALVIAKGLKTAQQKTLTEKIPLLRHASRQAENLKQFLRLFRELIKGCPFLDSENGSCSIYLQRPYSCRALISTRNSSWCAIDFAELHPQEKEAFLSSLDPEMVAFPTHYLAAPQELGLELEANALLAMREAFGVHLSGNLLYQIWLEQTHFLSEIIPQGYSVTRRYLEENQLDLPYLVRLQGS